MVLSMRYVRLDLMMVLWQVGTIITSTILASCHRGRLKPQYCNCSHGILRHVRSYYYVMYVMEHNALMMMGIIMFLHRREMRLCSSLGETPQSTRRMIMGRKTVTAL